MKFNQDLCLNLQYDFSKMNSTLGSVVPLAMFPLNECFQVFNTVVYFPDYEQDNFIRLEDSITKVVLTSNL